MVLWFNDVEVKLKNTFELVRSFYPGEDILKGRKGQLETYQLEDGVKAILRSEGQHFEECYTFEQAERLKGLIKGDLKSYMLRRVVYRVLSKGLSKQLAWGILTGIRPGKLLAYWVEDGIQEEKLVGLLQDIYDVSKDKAELLYSIYCAQKPVRENLDYRRYNLYIHIPFCPSRCSYCSFPAVCWGGYKHLEKDYIDCVIRELNMVTRAFGSDRLYTVYIGGGTPTSLSDEYFYKLLDKIAPLVEGSDMEFTLEGGRPQTLTDTKLKLMEGMVTRLSINTQTTNDTTLARIRRNHSFKDIVLAFERARKYDFKTINTDLILGLPGEDIKTMKESLKDVMDLSPENMTIHTLALKRGAGLEERFDLDMDLREMLDYSLLELEQHGYQPYYLYRQKAMVDQLENIGYTLEGHINQYNIAMMEELCHTIGIGMGAVSKLFTEKNKFIRFSNYKDLSLYIKDFDQLMEKKQAALSCL